MTIPAGASAPAHLRWHELLSTPGIAVMREAVCVRGLGGMQKYVTAPSGGARKRKCAGRMKPSAQRPIVYNLSMCVCALLLHRVLGTAASVYVTKSASRHPQGVQCMRSILAYVVIISVSVGGQGERRRMTGGSNISIRKPAATAAVYHEGNQLRQPLCMAYVSASIKSARRRVKAALALTKAVGHVPCSRAGWYAPHRTSGTHARNMPAVKKLVKACVGW